jgi:sulfopyruvate decarboxylase subunit alpha
MVGQFGREFSNFGQPTTTSRRTMVAMAEPLLKAINVPFHCMESEADLPLIDKAFEQAEGQRTAVVLLVGAPMAWH